MVLPLAGDHGSLLAPLIVLNIFEVIISLPKLTIVVYVLVIVFVIF